MPQLPLFLRNFRYRLFYGLMIKRNGRPLMELGSRQEDCAWTFCPEGLNADSIVYSGGIGRDISFEHGLVKNFGCSVVLLDPSPTGLKTMNRPENKIPQFKFHPVALTNRCGTIKFGQPVSDEGSWSMQRQDAGAVEVPCTDLSSLMQQNNHKHIDLLKIDIEGSEYDVIDDLLKKKLSIKQLLVEFHHGVPDVPGITRQQTVQAILKLRAAGYWLLSQDGSNHTFLRKY